MQNKGAITLLAIALALVSLYQLSFTWKTNRVEKVAREYAQGDPVKEKFIWILLQTRKFTISWELHNTLTKSVKSWN